MNNLRPTVHDSAVIDGAVERFSDQIKLWNKAYDVYLQNWQVAEALHTGDAYAAVVYLGVNFNILGTTDLVILLDRIIDAMPRVATEKVHEWVMATGTRFPAKEGNTIRFANGQTERHGVVHAVISTEARALVEDVSNRGKYISITAEEVTKVVSRGDARQPDNGPHNPTGGTPVAARGGALLREAA
jgi:hypothetical protein